MKKKEREHSHTIQEALDKFLDQYKLKGQIQGSEVKAVWAKAMGKTVSSRTESLWFQDGKLVVKLASGPLKHQLLASRSKVLALLNEALGAEVVKEVVIL